MCRDEHSYIYAFFSFPSKNKFGGKTYMNRNKAKYQNGSWSLSLPFEVERLMQLDKEFTSEGELPGLMEHKRILYDEIWGAMSKEMRQKMADYSDTGSRIEDLQREFYYKKGFIDCRAIMRFLFGCKNNIKLNIRIM